MASPPPKVPESKAKDNSDAATEEKLKARRRIFAKFALAHTTDADGQDSCIPATLVPVALRQLGFFPPKKVSEDAKNGATWTQFEKLCDREEKRRQPTEADFISAIKTIAKAQRNKDANEAAKKDESAQKETETEPTCVRLQVLKDAFTNGPDALQGEELAFAVALAERGIIANSDAAAESDKENPLVSIESFSKVLSNPPPPEETDSNKGAAAGSSSAASPSQADENKNDQQRAESAGNGSGTDGKKDDSKSGDQNGQGAAGKENSNANNTNSDSSGGSGGTSSDQKSQEQKPKEEGSAESKSRAAPPPEKKEEEKKGCCAAM
jgi:hypothetical protein